MIRYALDGQAFMMPHHDGEYVSHDDYLEAISALTDQRDRLAGLLREVVDKLQPPASQHGYWHNEAGSVFRDTLPKIKAALAETDKT